MARQISNTEIMGNTVRTTAEQPTGETWIDGRMIYQRSITGTITAASGAYSTVSLIPRGEYDVPLSCEGWWAYIGSSKSFVRTVTSGWMSTDLYGAGVAIRYSSPNDLVFYSQSINARSSSPFAISVRYTKP